MINVTNLSPALKVCIMLRQGSVFGKRNEILTLNILPRTEQVFKKLSKIFIKKSWSKNFLWELFLRHVHFQENQYFFFFLKKLVLITNTSRRRGKACKTNKNKSTEDSEYHYITGRFGLVFSHVFVALVFGWDFSGWFWSTDLSDWGDLSPSQTLKG